VLSGLGPLPALRAGEEIDGPMDMGLLVVPALRVAPANAPPDEGVVPVGCASCGLSVPHHDLTLPRPAPCDGCGCNCIPGRLECYCPPVSDSAGCVARFCHGVYECICCPDPCYEPHWKPIADSAFFVESARPVTQMKIRLDAGWDLTAPDRAEYFWARERTTRNQVSLVSTRTGAGKGPAGITQRLRYQEPSLITEAGTETFGLTLELPYRKYEVTAAPTPFGAVGGASGFGDLKIGTKAVILDCELLQIAFGFKTTVPTGDFTHGLGIGHVALEPALLFGLKLTESAYLQASINYWIPIGGDDLYQATILHEHLSCNHVLWQRGHGLILVGTLEGSVFSILGGSYTNSILEVPDPNNGGMLAPLATRGSATIAYAGPGVRLFICDKLDVGAGVAFAVTDPRWAAELLRFEFRWRF
jgi:hypothetical protein